MPRFEAGVGVGLDPDLRDVGAEHGEGARDPWLLLHLAHQGLRLLLQDGRAHIGAILDHQHEPAGTADATHRRRAEHRHLGVEDLLCERLPHLLAITSLARSGSRRSA